MHGASNLSCAHHSCSPSAHAFAAHTCGRFSGRQPWAAPQAGCWQSPRCLVLFAFENATCLVIAGEFVHRTVCLLLCSVLVRYWVCVQYCPDTCRINPVRGVLYRVTNDGNSCYIFCADFMSHSFVFVFLVDVMCKLQNQPDLPRYCH